MVHPNDPAVTLFKMGSDADVVPQMLARVGYCSADQFAPLIDGPDWYMTLRKYAETKTAQEFIDHINVRCAARANLPADLSFTWKSADSNKMTEAMDEIDLKLQDSKMRVVADLQNGVSSHVVTIQGITEDCKYIVQNSAGLYDTPAVIYSLYGDLHVQLWDREILAKKLVGYGYFERKTTKKWLSIFGN